MLFTTPWDLLRPLKEKLCQALPVWLLLWTMSTLGPMQMIPQISHFSFPLGSRMPPTPDKAELPWSLWEPFIFSPEASSIRKSSAHSSPFISQARPFSSSLWVSTLTLLAERNNTGSHSVSLKKTKQQHNTAKRQSNGRKKQLDRVLSMYQGEGSLSFPYVQSTVGLNGSPWDAPGREIREGPAAPLQKSK